MIIKPDHPDKLVRFLCERPIILYGMGDTGRRIAKWCADYGIPYLISDKDTDKLAEFRDTRVVLPQKISTDYPEANVVISSIAYIKEITEDLLRLGIAKERIFQPFIFMPNRVTVKDLEADGRIDWERMSLRCKMVSEWDWIPEEVQTVVDYSAGEGLLIKKYLPDNAVYYPIDYADRGENTQVFDFGQKKFPDTFAELSICFAMAMYTDAANELIDNICEHTGSRSIFTAITLEGLPDICVRRYSGMVSDLTEREVIDRFGQNQFTLTDKRYHTAGNSTMTFFLFERSDGNR